MTATAAEIKNRFGAFVDEAQRAPGTVESDGRPRAVLLSHDDCQRLQAMEDHYWLRRAAEAEESGYVGGEEATARLTDGLNAPEE